MRILCLTARLPYPPDRGDRLRAYHILRRLASEHELELFSLISSPTERRHLAPLEEFCSRVHTVTMNRRQSILSTLTKLWRPLPLQALYFHSRTLAHAIDERLHTTSFDAAYVHLFRMAPYLERHTGLYRVLDLTDAISVEIARAQPYRSLWWRLVYRIEQPRIARYERKVASAFDESWVISEAERKALAPHCPKAKLRVVPNGVDLESFHSRTDLQEANPLLVFVGHLRVPHNIDAAHFLATEIFPLVRRRLPHCRLALVGADPAPKLRRLASDPAIEVPGFVPDLNSVLQRATVFAAPLRFSAGVQNKVLEAMAASCAVVTTSQVNEGLGARSGEELVLAHNAEATAQAILDLVADPARRRRLGDKARQFVGQHFSWEPAAVRMRQIQDSQCG